MSFRQTFGAFANFLSTHGISPMSVRITISANAMAADQIALAIKEEFRDLMYDADLKVTGIREGNCHAIRFFVVPR